MTTFAKAWPGSSIAQQPVAQLPWGHITVLLDKIQPRKDRDWYAAAAVNYGWSRNVLMNMIMNKTLERTGAAPSNFAQQLVAPHSELAQQVAKDPYNFEFLGLSGEVAERDLEKALTSRITETLRELGPGFSFVGRQVHFDVDGDDFYVDLLFFHIEQSRYVVMELKTGKFQPEYAGKLNFYVALVDDVLRREPPQRNHRDPDLRQQERPQRPVQPGTLHLTHGRRRLHLRQAPRGGTASTS